MKSPKKIPRGPGEICQEEEDKEKAQNKEENANLKDKTVCVTTNWYKSQRRKSKENGG